MGLLKCTKCLEYKEATPSFFPLHNKKKNGLDSWCRACRNSYRNSIRVPEGVNNIARALEAKSLKLCIICGTTESVFAVDHDHSNGHVRGSLCTNCNLGLGHFKDDPELLRLAALYLEGLCACGKCTPYWGGIPEYDSNPIPLRRTVTDG